MRIETVPQKDPNVEVHEVEILGRQITIETTKHKDRDPEQITYRVSGDFEGTHMESGFIGVTTETDTKNVLKHLREEVVYLMENPFEPDVDDGDNGRGG